MKKTDEELAEIWRVAFVEVIGCDNLYSREALALQAAASAIAAVREERAEEVRVLREALECVANANAPISPSMVARHVSRSALIEIARKALEGK